MHKMLKIYFGFTLVLLLNVVGINCNDDDSGVILPSMCEGICRNVLSLCPFNYIVKDFFSECFSSLNVKHQLFDEVNNRMCDTSS